MRILWLKTELLHPVDKGGKIRTYAMLRELRRDHQITFLTLDDGSASDDATERANEYCHELIRVPHKVTPKFSVGFYSELAGNLASKFPYAIKKYQSSQMKAYIEQITKSDRFDLLICDFLAPAINVPARIQIPNLLFQHNVEAMIWERHFAIQKDPLKRAYLKAQWKKMISFERSSCQRFDTVVAVSPEDRDRLQSEYQVENTYDVATGVDPNFFSPDPNVPQQRNNLVFTGSMDWLPNDDAILFFTESILPLILQRVPDVSLTVVGRNPSPRLVELSKRDNRVKCTGRVEDVRPFVNAAAAYIVPLRVAGGTRLKIFEAMAMEKAIVSTSIGAEGLSVNHGEDLLIADSPEDFANAVVRVLKDKSLAHDLGQRAAKTVRQSFSWSKVAEAFAGLCSSTVDRVKTNRNNGR